MPQRLLLRTKTHSKEIKQYTCSKAHWLLQWRSWQHIKHTHALVFHNIRPSLLSAASLASNSSEKASANPALAHLKPWPCTNLRRLPWANFLNLTKMYKLTTWSFLTLPTRSSYIRSSPRAGKASSSEATTRFLRPRMASNSPSTWMLPLARVWRLLTLPTCGSLKVMENWASSWCMAPRKRAASRERQRIGARYLSSDTDE